MARKHVFVSFTDRVAAIHIDPIRRSEAKRNAPEGSQKDSSFVSTLERWNELNLASYYTEFSSKCMPISQSLPMVFYNDEAIFNLLEEYLSKTDQHSVEPLLDLLVQLAHDLGEDFEKFYPRALRSCISLIEKNQRSDEKLIIVESTFNALAHLYKYLARLLTTNLIPTYDLVLPLFGGDPSRKQRGFVLRFAAESMGFLIRRAQGEGLHSIVDHIVSLVSKSPNNKQFMASSSQLLATTLKGPGTRAHSKAPSLLGVYFDSCRKYSNVQLASSILVDTLHHVRRETAEPIQTAVVKFCSQYRDEFAAQLLFNLAGLRKGDRVVSWDSLYASVMNLELSPDDFLPWCEAAASVLSFADLSSSMKFIQPLLSSVTSQIALATIAKLVFITSPGIFKAFESNFWEALHSKTDTKATKDLEVLALLSIDTGKPQHLSISIKQEFTVAPHQALFNLWWRLKISGPLENGERFLRYSLSLDLGKDSPELSALQSLVVSELLDKYGDHDDMITAIRLPLIPQLLHAITSRAKNSTPSEKLEILNSLSGRIDRALRSCDRRIRGSALQTISTLIHSEDDPLFLLDQCVVINDLPFDLENAKSIAHRIRSLASKFVLAGEATINAKRVSEFVLSFFFGMLTARFQPVSSAVFSVIAKLSGKSPDTVCMLALDFIRNPHNRVPPLVLDNDDIMDDESSVPAIIDLDCVTLSSLQSEASSTWTSLASPTYALEQRASISLEFQHYDDLRSLGIKVLSEIPEKAEKRVVPLLVPYLLDYGDDDDNADEGSSFTFQDRLALLELFAKIKHPEKLQNFEAVKDRYVYFLRSRHTPIQRIALKCLLTINDQDGKVLRKYREHMEALLDDKSFRDELATFICAEDDQKDEGSLHTDDRNLVLPFVVRILYGRAQNSTKQNMRGSVLSSLHSLDVRHLTMFVNVSIEHLRESKAIGEGIDYSDRSLSRKAQGFLTLMNDFIRHLRASSKPVVELIVSEGVFPILDNVNLRDDKALRQLLTKVLDEMVQSFPSIKVWAQLFPHISQYLIDPQLENFGRRNLEHPSTIMHLFLTLSGEPGLARLINDRIFGALLSCLNYQGVKETVITLVLKVVINMIDNRSDDPATTSGIALVLSSLPRQMERDLSAEAFGLAVTTLNKIFARGTDGFDETLVNQLAEVSFKALNQPFRIVPVQYKGLLLGALSKLLMSPTTTEALIRSAYERLAPLFRQFSMRDARMNLSACYGVFGGRLPELSRVGNLVIELNSFDDSRLGEPDFARRSAVFEKINENLWSELTEEEWRPLIFNMLYFMRDPDELALRTNGKYAVMRLIESRSSPNLVENFVLPAIKNGLRESDEKFRRLYVDLLAQCARSDVMPSLKVLLMRGDEEADFFININHVQVHRRRRAVQRLGKMASELDESVVAHYLLSIVENLTLLSGNKNSELNNLADDALLAMTRLLQHVSIGQYKSVARRWVKNVQLGPEPAKLRKSVRALISVAQAGPPGIDQFITDVIIPPLQRILTARNNEHENLPDRVPLAVAITHFLKTLEHEALESQLPGMLINVCQLLRSKIPEMRDTVRQTLGRVTRVLGPNYLRFVITELNSALRRGGLQSHVLGYTVHYLLVELNRGESNALTVGDLDESAGLIFRIVMNDTFGNVGEEKDSDGYATTAKEVKQHKSYDTAEILARWTSLSQFGRIVEPIREFLTRTKLSTKAERKVEEVLNRLASGLHRNPQAESQDAVVMGYEIFQLSESIVSTESGNAEKAVKSGSLMAREEAARESEAFFTVQLSSRDWYETDSKVLDSVRYAAANLHMLQTFALDTLRSVLTSTAGGSAGDKGKGLLTIANVKGLVPVILKGLEANHEDLQMAALRLATTCFRLPVPLADGDDTLQVCGSRCLSFIESNPDVNSAIAQASLKFLTMLIRSKPEFEVSPDTVAYVLDRLRPDIEEPERQGSAISFIRAIFGRGILLPQVYDIADKISEVLVTNQSENIRSNCRAAFLQFLTTYPLGQTRFNRQLANLNANLRYSAASGRLSVMEMIGMLLHKARADQLQPSFVAFYANLVLVLITDNEPTCREKAGKLIKELVAKAADAVQTEMVTLCIKWLKSLGKNNLLVRGGLEVAPMLNNFSGNTDKELQEVLKSTVTQILEAGSRTSHEQVDWQLIYLALDTDLSDNMDLVEGVLLFPHPWVRSRAAQVVGRYFKGTPKSEISPEFLLRVGKRLVRQLSAPRLPAEDGIQIVKDLVFIVPIWDAEQAVVAMDESETLAIDWLVQRLSSTLRVEISAAELVGGKTAAIQVLASLPSLVSKDTTARIAQQVILAFFVLIEQLSMEDVQEELRNLAQEALEFYNNALGTTEYYKRYSLAKQEVEEKRQARRSKRSIEAVANPELAARKRMKRNLHKRDARKVKSRESHYR